MVPTKVFTMDSQNLEHRCTITDAGSPSLSALGLEDGHDPTFWLLVERSPHAGFAISELSKSVP